MGVTLDGRHHLLFKEQGKEDFSNIELHLLSDKDTPCSCTFDTVLTHEGTVHRSYVSFRVWKDTITSTDTAYYGKA